VRDLVPGIGVYPGWEHAVILHAGHGVTAKDLWIGHTDLSIAREFLRYQRRNLCHNEKS
jgi:hypothetical protein